MRNNVFDFKTKESEMQVKKVNKKKIIVIIVMFIAITSIVGLISIYNFNEDFRMLWDYTVLRKEVESEDVKSISLQKENLKYPYSYDKKTVVLEKNVLKIYSQEGNEETTLDVNITTPVFSDNNRFLAIAEKDGNKVYLLNDRNIAWQKDLEGTISRTYVNKNGYVCIATTGVGYKTVIVLCSPSGEELFKTYLPTTYCVDIEMSNDNKYIAIAEVSSAGTMMETAIKIISVENAKVKPKDAFIATYNLNSNKMILNLKYLDNGKLVALYEDSVLYANDTMENIMAIDSNTLFIDIESNDKVVSIKKSNGGLLKINYILTINNLSTGKIIEYNLMELPKELYVKNDVIAVNYGTDVELISATSGWLIKKYVSRQEIKSVMITNSFVSVLYNDEIKLIKI